MPKFYTMYTLYYLSQQITAYSRKNSLVPKLL